MRDKIKRYTINLTKIVVAGIVVYTGSVYAIDYYQHSEMEKARLKTQNRVIMESKEQLEFELKEKVKNLENEVLESLANCETGGIKDRDGAILLDTNNEMSIGRYMFQRNTVIHYYKRLYGKQIGRADAIKIAVDKEKATELARDILFDTKLGYKNWWNCNKKLNLKTKIEIIKKLK